MPLWFATRNDIRRSGSGEHVPLHCMSAPDRGNRRSRRSFPEVAGQD
jgi:hypothetical protein